MEKIISLFQRNYDGNRLVRDELVPGAEWVIAGEGVATRKWDGTSCMVRLYKRYDARAGKAPAGFEPAEPAPNEHTGHWPGWLPVSDGPEDRWHREAWTQQTEILSDGTYELLGPKIQGNPERIASHTLVPHGDEVLPDVPRDYAGLRHYLEAHNIEGIVWHHPDGRMVKIKAKDFGLKRMVAVE